MRKHKNQVLGSHMHISAARRSSVRVKFFPQFRDCTESVHSSQDQIHQYFASFPVWVTVRCLNVSFDRVANWTDEFHLFSFALKSEELNWKLVISFGFYIFCSTAASDFDETRSMAFTRFGLHVFGCSVTDSVTAAFHMTTIQLCNNTLRA